MRQTTEPTNAKEWEASFYDMGDLAAWHQRRANAAEAEVVRLRQLADAAMREIISLMPPGATNGRAYTEARIIAEDFLDGTYEPEEAEVG